MHEITTNLHEHEGVEDKRVVLICWISIGITTILNIKKFVALEEKYKADSQLVDRMTYKINIREMSAGWRW